MAGATAPRALLLACTLLLPITACGWLRPAPSEAQQLQQRLAVSLQPQLSLGQAALEPVPDGVRVTLLTAPLFPGGRSELDDKGKLTLAGVIQGLLNLDRTQMNVEACPGVVAGSYACQTPAARAASIIQYFEQNGFSPPMVSTSNTSLPPGTATGPAVQEPMVVLTLRPVAA